MIRRNHIQKVTRVERSNLREKTKEPASSLNIHQFELRRDGELFGEEAYRATSSNKKYHQYKDWKQQNKNKRDQQQSKPLKTRAPLEELPSNQYQSATKIKKEHEAELQSVLKKQYLSEFNHDQPRRKAYSSATPAPYRYLPAHLSSRQPLDIQTSESSLPRSSYQQAPTGSPSRRIRYSELPRKQSLATSHERQGLHLQAPYVSNSKKTSFQFDSSDRILKRPFRECPNFEDISQVPRLHAMPGQSKRMQEEMITRYAVTVGKDGMNRDERHGWQRGNGLLGSLQVEEGRDQKVATKLRMISDFNDQINDRIKNIISCFEDLRTKL